MRDWRLPSWRKIGRYGPVLMLDLNTNKYDAPEVLETKLDDSLRQWEKLYGCEREDLPLGMRFESVIRGAAEQTSEDRGEK